MKTYKQSNSLVLPLIVLLLGLVALVYLVGQKTFFSPKANPTSGNFEIFNDITTINNAQDLNHQLKNLDNVDVNQINRSLNENTTDLTKF